MAIKKILTKYADTISLQDNTSKTQKEYINALAENETNTIAPVDSRTPFTYRQWIERHVGITPNQAYRQYNEYLRNWYSETYTTDDYKEQIAETYKALLKEIALTFKDDAQAQVLQDLDFDNDLELEEAIPHFARKLKEISIYLASKRESLKRTKLKYNMTGAVQALERLFYEYLLKAFTKRQYVLNIPEQSAYDALPDLSAVGRGFQITIEELYDGTEYFDKDPIQPASTYFNLTSEDVIDYFTNLNFASGDLEWLYHTGFSQLCSDNPLFYVTPAELSALPDSAFIDSARKILNDDYRIKLAQKYMGEMQYFVSGGHYTLWEKDINYSLSAGNTWFYWPTGEYYEEIINDKIITTIDNITLSSTNLINDGAVAAELPENADKIFIQTADGIEGAWLRLIKDTTDTAEMSAIIAPGKNRFKFPYPGYGIKGDNLNWTGPQLSNLDTTFNYLKKNTQSEIKNLYWTLSDAVSTITPININDTQLIESGAHAALTFNDADQIITRPETTDGVHDSTPNNIFQANQNYAWLYRMNRTDIPIDIGKNYILWPVQTYNTAETVKLKANTTGITPIRIGYINPQTQMIGARAGSDLYNSDIIYKLDSYNGYPIEAAWLKGQSLDTIVPGATGVIQTSLNLRCMPGDYETFIWCDTAREINDIPAFQHKEHQIDCEYLNAEHNSLYEARYTRLEDLGEVEFGISNHRKCTCRSIFYSPLGHPGTSYDDYDKMADIVFVDTTFPEPFNLHEWRGRDDEPYWSSDDFAWFKLNNAQIEPDVGWGPGQWMTGSGKTNFKLEQGVRYMYLRANLRRAPDELFAAAVPELIVKQPYINDVSAIWCRSYINEFGQWIASFDESPMIINPGDFLLYDHINTNWYCLTSVDTRFTAYTQSDATSTSDEFKYWVNYSFGVTGTNVIAYWPSKFYENGPEIIDSQVTDVEWTVTKPDGDTYHAIINVQAPLSFILDKVGQYTINASASTYVAGDYIYPRDIIITSHNNVNVPVRTGTLSHETIYNNTIGFTLNVDLSGWDYENNMANYYSPGGRPFWALAADNMSSTTKYKRINYFGGGIHYPINHYTFVSQPDIADFDLDINQYIEYTRNNNSTFIWKQPLEIISNREEKQWCKLVIDPTTVSPLSTYMYNISTELTVISTNSASDIILMPFYKEQPVLVNYWANSAFNWMQKITNTSLGLPPTGGVWVPYLTGEYLTPQVSYANLTNRHYPTIATMPSIDDLYSEADVGGYFLPKGLGISTFLGRDYTHIIDTDKTLASDATVETYRNILNYTTDRGLTHIDQDAPIKEINNDPSWMKAPPTESYRAGTINNVHTYQEFIPYQTKYESIGQDQAGIRYVTDEYDPWTGEADSTWMDEVAWPPEFRKQYDIQGWYEQLLPSNKFFYQWRTDIFGHQYALLKDTSYVSNYEKMLANGELYVRNLNGKVAAGSVLLEDIYSNFGNAQQTELTSNQIKDFDVWYDTIMFYTGSSVLIEGLTLDYETGEIQGIPDNIHYFDISPDTGCYYGDGWLFEEQKDVILSFVCISANRIAPYIYSLNLDTHNVIAKLPLSESILDTQVISTTSLGVTGIERPVFTYNQNTYTYNMSFIAHPGPFIISIDISGEDFIIDSIKAVEFNNLSPL